MRGQRLHRQLVTGAGAFALAAGLTLAGAAEAADADGNYAVRGAGTQSCEAFAGAVDGRTPEIAVHMAWMEGYLSAHNRMADGTFDASPFVSPGEVVALVRNICRANPEIRVETALARLINMLEPHRVQRESEILTLAADDQRVLIRSATLRRVQEKLREKGLYTLAPDGIFGPGTRRAVQQFQERESLPNRTGLPDADTLIRLFFDRP